MTNLWLLWSTNSQTDHASCWVQPQGSSLLKKSGDCRKAWKSLRGHLKCLHLLYNLNFLPHIANNFYLPPFFSFGFAGCFLNAMKNVCGAWTSDRQTFVLVLFLHQLSLQIWVEVLRGLPLSLSLLFLLLYFHTYSTRIYNLSNPTTTKNFTLLFPSSTWEVVTRPCTVLAWFVN